MLTFTYAFLLCCILPFYSYSSHKAFRSSGTEYTRTWSFGSPSFKKAEEKVSDFLEENQNK